MQNRGDYNADRFEWFHLFGKLGVTALGHPFEYVKVLIQIGHEPFPPKPTRTLLGKPALGLTGAFAYMKHIKSIDGVFGLYRGLFPKLCTNFVSMSTYIIAYEKVPSLDSNKQLQQISESELTDEQKLALFAHELMKSTVARTASIIVSHPFYIITLRSMAQFVGRETKYSGIFGSLREIFNEDGILGFFSGLVPRLIGEILSMLLAASASVLINTYLVDEESAKTYVKALMGYLAGALFYPFTVVSHVVIVNNCGLKAGMPGNMPIYSNWSDCWSHLSAIGQLKRGSSILWRYHTGPFMTSAYSGSSGRRVHAQAFPYSVK
ncbi:mitochondrial carrier homolog 2 [Parasteatoda tepidariorum]|uniref:Mitochondrial carrier-like protein n=1 Tax=Parasteatoda tepidariorum TaxID=114398 RepID=A0A2L2Y9F3_PARTP|nr:mitochondrial carrier homolog 2 [Parasteatoda tepidariorum]